MEVVRARMMMKRRVKSTMSIMVNCSQTMGKKYTTIKGTMKRFTLPTKVVARIHLRHWTTIIDPFMSLQPEVCVPQARQIPVRHEEEIIP